MTDRATVRPPNPESKIPIGASTGARTGGTTSKGRRRSRLSAPCRRARHAATSFSPIAGTDGPAREEGGGVADAAAASAWSRRSGTGKTAEEALRDLQARIDNAQQLAHMGDYDWEIATDTNTWSDQLFRIYGHEPAVVHPSYEQFLSMIHPDDQERIRAIHQQAYATGEPYEMIERIVRPDGEVRYLSSNGQVVTDESGTPIRMRGTCIDITERVHAEEEREAHAARVHEEQTRRQAALEINDSRRPGADRRALRPRARRHRRRARLRAPHPRLGPRDHHRPGRPGRGRGRPRRPGPQLALDAARLTWSGCQARTSLAALRARRCLAPTVASTSAASNASPGAMAPGPRWRPSRSRTAPSTTIGAVTA